MDASSSTARTPWNGSTRALRRRAIRPTRWPPMASRRSISAVAIRAAWSAISSLARVSGGQRVLFYSGDDADAKAAVRGLMEKAGFFPIDLGALDIGGPLASLPFGPLAGVSLVKI